MKKTKFQKLLSLILALMVVFGTIPTSILPVSAANNADGSGGSNGSYSGLGTYNAKDCMWKVSVYVALKDTVNAETSGSECALSDTNYWTRYGNPIFLMKGNNSTLKGRLANSLFFWGDKVDLMKQSTSASQVSLTPAYSSAITPHILYDDNSKYVPIDNLNDIDDVKAYFANPNNFFYILRKIAAAYSSKSVTSIDTVAELLAPIADKYVTIDGIKKKVYQSNGTTANSWHNGSKGTATTKDYNGKFITLSPFSGNGGSSTAAVDWLVVYEPIFQVEPPSHLAGKKYICATPTELAVLGETSLKDKLGGLKANFAYKTFPGAVFLQKSWLGYAKGTDLKENATANTILKQYGWGMRHAVSPSKTSPASKYTLLDFSITASVDRTNDNSFLLWNLL